MSMLDKAGDLLAAGGQCALGFCTRVYGKAAEHPVIAASALAMVAVAAVIANDDRAQDAVDLAFKVLNGAGNYSPEALDIGAAQERVMIMGKDVTDKLHHISEAPPKPALQSLKELCTAIIRDVSFPAVIAGSGFAYAATHPYRNKVALEKAKAESNSHSI